MWQGCAIHWGSRKQSAIALSSLESEVMALSEAGKDMVYFRKFVSGVTATDPGPPSDLHTDNTGARNSSYNPEGHDKVKHIERRHFWVRDMVEAGELRVPYVKTADNLADFLTKPQPPKTFFRMRAIIMNEPKPPAAPAESY